MPRSGSLGCGLVEERWLLLMCGGIMGGGVD